MNKKEIGSLVKFFNTTSKVFVWWLMIAGTVWITWCFVLASMGNSAIAESLATQVCDTVFGGMSIYLITSCINNIFKYNDGLVMGTSKPYTEQNNE